MAQDDAPGLLVSTVLSKIDRMSATDVGKPEKALATQPPNPAHAELQSPPLLPRRQYAPRSTLDEAVGVSVGGRDGTAVGG